MRSFLSSQPSSDWTSFSAISVLVSTSSSFLSAVAAAAAADLGLRLLHLLLRLKGGWRRSYSE